MHSAYTQLTLSMRSGCNHRTCRGPRALAISMQSVCNQYAISMQSACNQRTCRGPRALAVHTSPCALNGPCCRRRRRPRVMTFLIRVRVMTSSFFSFGCSCRRRHCHCHRSVVPSDLCRRRHCRCSRHRHGCALVASAQHGARGRRRPTVQSAQLGVATCIVHPLRAVAVGLDIEDFRPATLLAQQAVR